MTFTFLHTLVIWIKNISMSHLASMCLKWRSKIRFALLRKNCVLICWSICYADIDECANETLCGSHGFCDNTVGSFHCLCDRGYTNSPSSHDCIGKSHSAFIDAHCLLIQNFQLVYQGYDLEENPLKITWGFCVCVCVWLIVFGIPTSQFSSFLWMKPYTVRIGLKKCNAQTNL